MTFEPPGQFLRHPHFFEPPADIGTHRHIGQDSVDRLDAINDIAQSFFRRFFGGGNALHLITTKAALPSPLRVFRRMLRCLIAGTLRNRHPLSKPSAKQMPNRHAQRLSAQIEHDLLKRTGHHRLRFGQINRPQISPQPAIKRCIDRLIGRKTLDLRQPR